MKYSNEMLAVINQLELKPENVMYLTIARSYLRRIVEGTKKVEFRSVTELYLKKLINVNSKGEVGDDKPITHILLQGGYSADSPRVLVEMTDWFIKDTDIRNNSDVVREKINRNVKAEAEAEGFTDNDEYLALVLGEVKYSENFKE